MSTCRIKLLSAIITLKPQNDPINQNFINLRHYLKTISTKATFISSFAELSVDTKNTLKSHSSECDIHLMRVHIDISKKVCLNVYLRNFLTFIILQITVLRTRPFGLVEHTLHKVTVDVTLLTNMNRFIQIWYML